MLCHTQPSHVPNMLEHVNSFKVDSVQWGRKPRLSLLCGVLCVASNSALA